MEELLKSLESLTLSVNAAEVEASLTILLKALDDENVSDKEKEERRIALMNGDIADKLRVSVESEHRELVAQLIAELAKTDAAREKCVSAGLIPPLLSVMRAGSLPQSIQACRALGNICFDNDEARNIVCEHEGLEGVIELLKRDVSGDDKATTVKLRKVACGFLFNLTNSSANLIDKALSLGVLEILNDYLKLYRTEEDILLMILLAVGALSDSESCQSRLIEETDIVTTIASFLTLPETTTELKESILDLFATLVENEDIKTSFAEHGLVDIFLDSLKAPPTGDSSAADHQKIQKMLFDLIILLLTGDRSMELLFSNGTGRIMTEAIEWMNSTDPHIEISGALAIGNIARTDTLCVRLAEMGVLEDLLKLLEKHPVDGGNISLHHAIFSSLRNLAIPLNNKRILLDCRLLSRILPYCETDSTFVQFKLLGTLRMVIDHQADAATSLGTNESFLARLSAWCAMEEHEGIRSEAQRLVAWLVKHSRSSEVMRAVVRSGALSYLVRMCGSEYALMQNEAIIALSLMSFTIIDSVADVFLEVDLLSCLKTLLETKTTAVEVLHNTLNLVKALTTSKVILERMRDTKFGDVLTCLKEAQPDVPVQLLVDLKQLAGEVCKDIEGVATS